MRTSTAMWKPVCFLQVFFLVILIARLVYSRHHSADIDDQQGLALWNELDDELKDSVMIFTNDGKIFSYLVSKREINWMVDLKMNLFELIVQQKKDSFPINMKEMGTNSIFFPTFEGDYIFYNKKEGFYRVGRDELDDVIKECQICAINTKFLNVVKEKIYLINTQEEKFIDMSEAMERGEDLSQFSGRSKKDLLFLKIEQKYLKSINMANMKENWSLISSQLNLYTYWNFFRNSTHHPNYMLDNDDIKIVKLSDKKIDIVKRKNEKHLFSIETDEDILFVLSSDQEGTFFKNKMQHNFHFLDKDLIKKLIFQSKEQAPQQEIKVFDSENGESGTSLAVYKSHFQDDLCVYTNKCLSPSLYEIRDLSDENFESSIIKCMIQIRKEKRKVDKNTTGLPTEAANETISSGLSEKNQEQKESWDSKKILTEQTISNLIVLIFSICAFGAYNFWRDRINKRSDVNLVSTQVQVSQHSIEKVENKLTFSENSEKNEMKPKKADALDGKPEKNNIPQLLKINNKETLGFGANGTVVFNGFFQKRNVAVKRVLIDYYHLVDAEIKILLKVDHPNIIKYYYVEETKDFFYIALEKCLCTIADIIKISTQEQNLRKVKRKVPLDEKTKQILSLIPEETHAKKAFFYTLTKDCLRGLNYLHSNNIIHRDLKPENVLIGVQKQAKLSDFAISKDLENNHKYNTNDLGTLGWRPREVILNEEKTKKTDIFSLGCIFFYIYTSGRHPFGESFERESKILNNEREFSPIVGDELFVDLISKMTDKNPSLRPDTHEIFNHPFFWSVLDKLGFFQEFSDYLETHDDDKNTLANKLDEQGRRCFLNKPWNSIIEMSLCREVLSYRKYNFLSIRDLIRVIRNKKNHYHELPHDIKILFNDSQEGVFEYFDTKFPKLFKFLLDFSKENKMSLISFKKKYI